MDPDDLPAAILAFLALVAILPAWVHYAGAFSPPEPEQAILGTLVIPAAAALLLTGWVRPELAGAVTGVFVLVGVIVVAPWLDALTGLAGGALAGHPLAELLVRATVAVLVVFFVLSLGRRRIRQ
jgi:hypothetical protein